MAVYEREKLIRRVLQELGRLDANEAPDAEDYTLVDDTFQQKAEELYEDGLIPFDIDGDIPARYFLSLVWITASALILTYGKLQRSSDIQANAILANARLWKLREQPYESTAAQTEYY